FLSRGRAFSEDENTALGASPVITGADYERGERPPGRAPVVGSAVEACPVPAGRAALGVPPGGHAGGLKR
ncbi:MAG: hypothetical protein WA925_05915, partial [Mycobacterium sp.]